MSIWFTWPKCVSLQICNTATVSFSINRSFNMSNPQHNWCWHLDWLCVCDQNEVLHCIDCVIGSTVASKSWQENCIRNYSCKPFILMCVIYCNIIIDRVAGAIIRLVASMCVCVSVRLSVGALLFELFDLWPWFLVWGSTLTLASLGLWVKVVGQRSRSNGENCLRSSVWTSGAEQVDIRTRLAEFSHYQSVGIVCLSVIRGVQRVARKRSIIFIKIATVSCLYILWMTRCIVLLHCESKNQGPDSCP